MINIFNNNKIKNGYTMLKVLLNRKSIKHTNVLKRYIFCITLCVIKHVNKEVYNLTT